MPLTVAKTVPRFKIDAKSVGSRSSARSLNVAATLQLSQIQASFLQQERRVCKPGKVLNDRIMRWKLADELKPLATKAAETIKPLGRTDFY